MTERYNLKKMREEIELDEAVRKQPDYRLSRDGLKKFVASRTKPRRQKPGDH